MLPLYLSVCPLFVKHSSPSQLQKPCSIFLNLVERVTAALQPHFTNIMTSSSMYLKLLLWIALETYILPILKPQIIVLSIQVKNISSISNPIKKQNWITNFLLNKKYGSSAVLVPSEKKNSSKLAFNYDCININSLKFG